MDGIVMTVIIAIIPLIIFFAILKYVIKIAIEDSHTAEDIRAIRNLLTRLDASMNAAKTKKAVKSVPRDLYTPSSNLPESSPSGDTPADQPEPPAPDVKESD